MAQENRGRAVGALFLILLGAYLFVVQFFPGLAFLSLNETNWPLVIVGIGVAFLLGALLLWQPGLMIPSAMMGGLGVLLFWQNSTHNWASWAYAWTLFPVMAGVGILMMNLMQGHWRQGLVAGGAPIVGGLVAFLIFGSFFGALGLVGQYWPLLLILFGLVVLTRAFWKRA